MIICNLLQINEIYPIYTIDLFCKCKNIIQTNKYFMVPVTYSDHQTRVFEQVKYSRTCKIKQNQPMWPDNIYGYRYEKSVSFLRFAYNIHSFFFLSVRIRSVALLIIFKTAFSMSSKIDKSSISFFAVNVGGKWMRNFYNYTNGDKKRGFLLRQETSFIPTDRFYKLIANSSCPNL